MIKYVISRAIEIAINQLIRLDPNQGLNLSQHNGKVLQIDIIEFNTPLFILLRNGVFFVHTQYQEKPDAIIRGQIIHFLQQFQSDKSLPSVEIEGDIDLALALQSMLQRINLNREEYLAFFTGDFTAQRLSTLLQQIKKTSQVTTKRTLEDFVEYIQEEQRFVPTKEEVEDFYEEINVLRLAIDRLEARINRIPQKALGKK